MTKLVKLITKVWTRDCKGVNHRVRLEYKEEQRKASYTFEVENNPLLAPPEAFCSENQKLLDHGSWQPLKTFLWAQKKNIYIAKNHEMNDILNCSVTEDTGLGLGEEDGC